MKTRTHLILAPMLLAAVAVALFAGTGSSVEATASKTGNGQRRGVTTPSVTVGDADRVASGIGDASQNEEVRLLEYAGDNAVFREGRELHRVSIGERVPGSAGLLRHVNATGVIVEFVADATAPALLLAVARGGIVQRPAADRIVPPIEQQFSISSVHMAKAPDTTPANPATER